MTQSPATAMSVTSSTSAPTSPRVRRRAPATAQPSQPPRWSQPPGTGPESWASSPVTARSPRAAPIPSEIVPTASGRVKAAKAQTIRTIGTMYAA